MSIYYGQSEPSEPEDLSQAAATQPIQIELRLPRRQPWVVYLTIALTVGFFLLQLASDVLLGDDYLLYLGAKVNEAIDAGQFWRLLTPVLLHGSIIHLSFNMYALYSIGRGLERYYGHGRFLLLYLIGALGGNVLSYWLAPYPSLGASTAIFGLAAAEGVFILRNRFLFGRQAGAMLVNLAVILAVNLFIGLSPRIDNWGHLGGLVGGLFFAWFAGPQLAMVGMPPVMEVEDQRSDGRAFMLFIFEGMLWGVIVLARMLSSKFL